MSLYDQAAFTAILGRLAGGEDLSADEMQQAIESMMTGEVPDAQVALFLTGLNVKGETADELVGAARALDELGIAFCFAPLWHGSMRHVARVRQRLGVPTIFNLLGPLANPAGAAYQVLGVGRAEVQPLLAEALCRLGVERAVVVHGEDGLDEVTLATGTVVLEVARGGIERHRWEPEDFGVARAGLEGLKVSGPAESAAIIRQVLAGQEGPARDIVVINAAAAIWTAGRAATLAEAANLAQQAIDAGHAEALLVRLGRLAAS
jgi:anthranilate phosphoribosyltransferase